MTFSLVGEISSVGVGVQGSAGAALAASGKVEANLKGLVGPDYSTLRV
jgi:hypothetical protein